MEQVRAVLSAGLDDYECGSLRRLRRISFFKFCFDQIEEAKVPTGGAETCECTLLNVSFLSCRN